MPGCPVVLHLLSHLEVLPTVPVSFPAALPSCSARVCKMGLGLMVLALVCGTRWMVATNRCLNLWSSHGSWRCQGVCD